MFGRRLVYCYYYLRLSSQKTKLLYVLVRLCLGVYESADDVCLLLKIGYGPWMCV